jgi:hypothetical protein
MRLNSSPPEGSSAFCCQEKIIALMRSCAASGKAAHLDGAARRIEPVAQSRADMRDKMAM